MRQAKTLREKIERRIARRRQEDVFLPREFADLGGEDQVLRVLRIWYGRNAWYGSDTVFMDVPLFHAYQESRFSVVRMVFSCRTTGMNKLEWLGTNRGRASI
jgi:hypothetical protein